MTTQDCLIFVEDRILLHLLKYHSSRKRHVAPRALSLSGIAEAVGSNKTYVPRCLAKLAASNQVREHFGRIKEGKRKQKYFLLTTEGKNSARKLEENLLNTVITVKLSNDNSERMEIDAVYQYIDGLGMDLDVTLLDICNLITRERVLEVEDLKKLRKMRFIDFSADAPTVLHFFGRKKEIATLENWIEDTHGHNIIFVHGIAGIGKTTLASKLVERYRGSKHLFWHNFHTLDTLRGVLLKIASFLSTLGWDHLDMYIRTHTDPDYYEISKILGKSIGPLDSVLIFDDFHKANDRIKDFFVYFLGMLSAPSRTKMLILSREIVPFYDRRDVLSRKTVAEMGLGGLDYESSKRFLEEKGIHKSMFKQIYGVTAGNPLFLEFFDSKDHLERYMHDELFSKLGDGERMILGMISIHRFPVAEDSLAKNQDYNYENLYVLIQKSIVKKDAHDKFFLHDLIKNFFYIRLSPARKRKYHLTAAKWYRERKSSIELIEAIYHLIEGGETDKACEVAITKSDFILDCGYALEYLAILDRFNERNVGIPLWPEILIVKGKASHMSGKWKQALSHFTQSADNSNVLGMDELRARALCESGHILEEQNQFDRAIECFKECLTISMRAKYIPGMGEAYRGIGRTHWRNSDYEDAIGNYRKCLELAQELNDQQLMASTLIDMGNVYDERMSTEKAIEHYERALDILNVSKNKYETARAYGNLAITYRRMESLTKAIDSNIKHLEIAEDLRDPKVTGYGYASLSFCYAKTGQLDQAREYAEKAKNIALKIDNQNIMYQVNKTYAYIYKHEQDWEKAIEFLNKGISADENMRSLYTHSDLYYELGLLHEEMDKTEEARNYFEKAIILYKELGLGQTRFVRELISRYQ
jgi:tetratricopeptide (TPR) repeat protein